MTHIEIREKFLKFFEEREHKIMPSSSLLPADPSVLFTTAGMQQFKPYYTGEKDAMKDFDSLNICSIQKCLRTSDIDEVGDESHLTFFEMLGNFSFGGYFKEEAIKYAYDFITKELDLKIDWVSVFAGEDGIPADEESEKIWKSVAPGIEIKKCGRKDNFWGPTGDEGPCGPTTEIYVNGIEIWNIVFNQYYQSADKKLSPLKTPGVDTGMGLERLVMAVQKTPTVFETDLFEPIMSQFPSDMPTRTKRIIADHVRAITFLACEKVIPSNKDRGYILRKLIRSALVYQRLYYGEGVKIDLYKYISYVISVFKDDKGKMIYSKLDDLKAGGTLMNETINEETQKFLATLERGIKELRKFVSPKNKNYTIGKSKYPQYNIGDYRTWGKILFRFYESYGLFPEIAQEILDMKFPPETFKVFDEELKKHQGLSRTASVGMFKGGLADTGVETTRLHTAAHLMLEALRRVLGEHIQQKGSNITPERLRFDFSHPEKVAPEQIAKVEEIVNEQINKKLPVRFEEMSVDEAKKIGATGVFEHKYGNRVKVYTIGPSTDSASSLQAGSGSPFSREICGGPHVTNTSELASNSHPEHQSKGHFKIVKEESASAGVRRIKAVLE